MNCVDQNTVEMFTSSTFMQDYLNISITHHTNGYYRNICVHTAVILFSLNTCHIEFEYLSVLKYI
jgi:hypothetical protein